MNYVSLCASVGNILSDIGDGTELASDVPGMTSPKVRALLNAVVGLAPGWKHLEVGTHMGATFISAMLGNMDAYGVSYDNFSQFQWGRTEEGGFFTTTLLAKHMDKYKDQMGHTELVREDFFNRLEHSERTGLPGQIDPPDSFFYDGNHEQKWQERAVLEAFKVCADNFVYIVDDWNLPGVREGTLEGFRRSKVKESQHWNLGKENTGDDFYEGIGIFVVSK